MDGRLPAHLEVAAIRRLAESQGGFAAVLRRGDADTGTIGVVILCRGAHPALYERTSSVDGTRRFMRILEQISENESEFSASLDRRLCRDPDLWLIEADIPDIERFVAALPH